MHLKKFVSKSLVCVPILGFFLSLSLCHATEQETLSPSKILQLNSENLQEILTSCQLLVVDVYTDWCPPCRHLAPIFQDLSKEYGPQYNFAKLNAEEQRSIAQQFQITGFPTILFIKNGELIGRHVGFMNKEKFKTEISRYLN